MKYIIHAVVEADFKRLEIEADSKEEAIDIYNQKWSNGEINFDDYNDNTRYVVKARNSNFRCDNSDCRKMVTRVVECPDPFNPNKKAWRYYYCDFHAKEAEAELDATSKPK